jgi:hypothetical protein
MGAVRRAVCKIGPRRAGFGSQGLPRGGSHVGGKIRLGAGKGLPRRCWVSGSFETRSTTIVNREKGLPGSRLGNKSRSLACRSRPAKKLGFRGLVWAENGLDSRLSTTTPRHARVVVRPPPDPEMTPAMFLATCLPSNCGALAPSYSSPYLQPNAPRRRPSTPAARRAPAGFHCCGKGLSPAGLSVTTARSATIAASPPRSEAEAGRLVQRYFHVQGLAKA